MNLLTLRDELSVRRTDVRAAVSQLHRERMVDALTMRLTLQGFVIGQSLSNAELPPLREPAKEGASPTNVPVNDGAAPVIVPVADSAPRVKLSVVKAA